MRPSEPTIDMPLIQGMSAARSARNEIAGLAARQHRQIGARHDLQHGAHGGHDLALAFGAAPGEVEHLAGGDVDALAAARLQQADAVEHQRHDRQQREDDQPRADAQDRLACGLVLLELGKIAIDCPHQPCDNHTAQG